MGYRGSKGKLEDWPLGSQGRSSLEMMKGGREGGSGTMKSRWIQKTDSRITQ